MKENEKESDKIKWTPFFLYWVDMWFKWNPYMLPFRHLWIEDE